MMENKLKQIVGWGWIPELEYYSPEWHGLVQAMADPHNHFQGFAGDSPEIVVEDMYLYVKDKVENE